MKFISNFLVKGRIIIFAVMMVICAFCAYLFTTVTVNNDMTKYLADNSNMKQGIEVMNGEFASPEEVASIRVMFENLNDEQIEAVKQKLINIPHVNSITYEKNSADYNKDGYTLFVVNSKFAYDTNEFLSIENSLATEFSGYKMKFMNDDIQSTKVPFSLLATAVILAVIILFIMSESWIEPLLFLFSVGVAVLISVGTNCVLPYVSEMSFSIAPVIQMVLSMDYSIILLNRYRIERKNNADKRDAMKNAITTTGSSIIASSFTTIVGLITLIFLSFKLGPELAIVLAKGVFISMVCTFAVMPTLIIAFDKVIEKTKKKYPEVKGNFLAKFAFKSRNVMPFVFVIAFIAFTILQSFTGITFTDRVPDPVADIFAKTNTVVLLYDNEDESAVDGLVEIIEKNKKVKQILGYTTTLGKKYSASEMSNVVSALGSDLSVDQSAIDILYFIKSGKEQSSLSLNEFLTFINDQASSNPLLKPYLNQELVDNLNSLSKFCNKETLTTPMSAKELCEILGVDEQTVSLVYVFAKANDKNFIPNGMTFEQFASFLQSDIVTNPLFAGFIDQSMTEQLDLFSKISNKQSLQTALSSDEISTIFGIEKQSVQGIFLISGKLKMTVPEFVNALLTNDAVSSMIDAEQKAQLETFNQIMHLVLGDAVLFHSQLASITGASESDTKMLFTLNQSKQGIDDSWNLSLEQFLSVIHNDILQNQNFASAFDQNTANLINAIYGITADIINDTQFSAQELYDTFNLILANLEGIFEFDTSALTKENIDLLYIFYSSVKQADANYKLSIIDFFNFLSEEFINDERFANFFTSDLKQTLVESKSQLIDAVSQMKSKNYSRLVINTEFKEEAEDTINFVKLIDDYTKNNFSKNSYLIGNSAMVYEMQASFKNEYTLISLLTAIAIFIVVLLTFKNFFVSLILTLLVQCGVYVTVTVIGINGGFMYYLALLIVQSILMGATIDYGIVFCSCYKESRQTLNVTDALANAYKYSLHTILTSGVILVLVILILGILTTINMISQVCITLAIGAFVAILLILLVLPALAVKFDKFIAKVKQ